MIHLQEDKTDWPNAFSDISERFGHYWLDYLEENRNNFQLLKLELNNLQMALLQIYAEGDPHAFYKGVYYLIDYLFATGNISLASQLIYFDGQTESEVKHNPVQELLFGQMAERNGNFEGAIDHYERALQGISYNDGEDVLIDAYSALFLVKVKRTDYEDANRLRLDIEALDIQNPKNQATYVKFLRSRGRLRFELNLLDLAMKDYQFGYQLALDTNRYDVACGFLLNMSTLEGRSGNFSQAKSYLEQGEKIAEQHGYIDYLSQILLNQAAADFNFGELDPAAKKIQYAMDIAQRAGHVELLNRLRLNLAAIYMNTERFVEAMDVLKLATEYFRIVQTHDLVFCLINLGMTAQLMQKPEDAVSYLVEAVQQAHDMQAWMHQASALIDLGWLYKETQQWDLAIKYLQDGCKIARTENYKDLIGQSLLRLAECYFELGKFAKAKNLSAESLKVLSDINHHDATTVQDWIDEHLD